MRWSFVLAVALLGACGSDDPSSPSLAVTGTYGGIVMERDDGVIFNLNDPVGGSDDFDPLVRIFLSHEVEVRSSDGPVDLHEIPEGTALRVILSDDPCFDSAPPICGPASVSVLD